MGTITHDDIAQALSEALEAAQASGDGTIDYSQGMSMSEIAHHLDVSLSRARRRVRIAIGNGVVECTGRQPRPNIAGEMNAVPVYRVKKEREE
jgi:DNA-binding transcriptional regulator LsrR (DeoR family)